MWIGHNEGFVSIVADRNNPDRLLVRARREEDLTAVLMPALSNDAFRKIEIFSDTGSDYKWRAFVPRDDVAKVISYWIMNIQYDNFKNSVKSDELHELYANFWQLHWEYQKNDPRNYKDRRGKRH